MSDEIQPPVPTAQSPFLDHAEPQPAVTGAGMDNAQLFPDCPGRHIGHGLCYRQWAAGYLSGMATGALISRQTVL